MTRSLVVASSRNAIICFFAFWLAAGCAKGSGEGSAVGQVWAPDCGLDGQPFELNPSFFAMQPSSSVEIIDIIVQRGSQLQSFSDGIAVFIGDPESLKNSMLGTEIEFQLLDSPVEMTFYLNDTCPGIARIPVVYRAVSGTIRFDALFVPWLENETKETSAIFTDVELVDTQEPERRRAILSGYFTFLFERGLPPQLFQY
jgi:hypothetical protein